MIIHGQDEAIRQHNNTNSDRLSTHKLKKSRGDP